MNVTSGKHARTTSGPATRAAQEFHQLAQELDSWAEPVFGVLLHSLGRYKHRS